MFVRKKKNRSGTTSVVVVDKHGGKFKELHTVGIANSDEEIEKLLIQGKAWINSYLGVQKLDFDGPKRKEEELYAAKAMLGDMENTFHLRNWKNIENKLVTGCELADFLYSASVIGKQFGTEY